MHEDEVLFTEFFNQRLKERGLSLKHLSEATGIAIKHLESFGHGRFENLPSAPYLHGYFMKLGPIMGFDPNEWWSRVKAEDTVHKSGSGDRMPGNRFSHMRGRWLIWTGIVVVLVLIYIGARLTTILGEPRLMLTAPDACVGTITSSELAFQGTVNNGDALTINGASVPLAQNGSFSTNVALQSGPNTIKLEARKTLGRTVSLTCQIYYDDSQIIAPAPGFVAMPASTSVPEPTPTSTPAL